MCEKKKIISQIFKERESEKRNKRRRIMKISSTQYALTVIPFGMLVAAGGAMGYMKKGSVMSLISGITFCASQVRPKTKISFSFSLRPTNSNFKQVALADRSRRKAGNGKRFDTEIKISLVIIALLGLFMLKRFVSSRKFMPAGLVSLMSTLVGVFLYRSKSKLNR